MEAIDYGVARLSLIAVRAEPSDKAEQVTQLLFGEQYEVLDRSKNSKWFLIRTTFDQYEGWIDVAQHHPISAEYFEYLSRAEFKITTDVTSSILYNKNSLAILMGSMIPISSSELFKMEEQFAFNGEAKNVGQKRDYEFVKSIATKYIHAPYQWGGRSPFGIDCSGLMQMIFKISGYRLNRDAAQQALQGKAVDHVEDVIPGDIAFFKNVEGKIIHTGMLMERSRIIHATGKVRIDTFHPDGIIHADTGMLTHHLAHIRRILPETM